MQTNVKFESIHSIPSYKSYNHSIASGLSENIIYLFKNNSITKTKYNYYFEYYSNEWEMTFKSINLNENYKNINNNENESGIEVKINNKLSEELSGISVNNQGHIFLFTYSIYLFIHKYFCLKIVNLSENISEEYSLNRYKTRFEELAPIGSGSFGEVFKVKHRFDDQLYAVKKVIIKSEICFYENYF